MRPRFLLTARLALAAALLGLLLGAGCTSKCPRPAAYDETTLKQIQQAISDLPADSILRSVMHDYENERDDLRFCR